MGSSSRPPSISQSGRRQSHATHHKGVTVKKILLPLATVLALAASAPAAAATAGPTNFNVKVTLTPSCSITQAPTDVVFTYTSFGGVQTATGGAFKVKCTNGLGYTVGLDALS